jgi:hypothetical protein
MKTTPIKCVITGKRHLFNTEYINSKAEKMEGLDNLMKYYITSDAKKLLEKGLSINEVRKILGSTSEIDINNDYLVNIKKYNNVDLRNSSFVPLSVITCFETDPDVKEFLSSL